ncbi:MAG: hypothetical protein A3A90_00320 [Candidatus Zambryskibacteria bacterium RIFCSPLOWO2_01_FULL_35_19]|uniref:Homing endonuclease LAGLIDADG domain-containing protein n=1 Tax=Candidatus Zambryskibacteria bacterium RIFCSPLOWO2_01_FULL_35_19 TaxID=1802757 RepID=A0A1G2TYU8_9BACT|nr:MAG: hypothetical protein A2726_00715 [Candidatus Zambryskibacteria bacterium RIFCSPHIGHO2_01_FULL_35_32]OHB02478.1 MAG: hypothetical protein A3A90_00320 [Candidatus Zambryskibacteria bacterium RIFCSPLOWO2_01_FULL_35_19]
MGSRKYNLNLKSEAIKLRLAGYSYNQIRQKLGIASKGTISYWLHGLVLTESAKKLLEKNTELSYRRGLFKANKIRSEKIKSENISYFAVGENKIKRLSKRDLMIVGIALYWGEGTKYEPENTTNRGLIFTNSDPKMISVYMRFIREILYIPEDKIRAGIHIYPSINKNTATKFWSEITNLPKDRFYVITQISRVSKSKRKTDSLPNGTVVIRVNGRAYFYTMKGMIASLIKQ